MKIFIDAISPKGTLILFENNKIIAQERIEVLGHEFDSFLEMLVSFLGKNNLKIGDIDGIFAVNGPGGFTGTRVISLIVNTLQFVHKIPVETIDYFQLLEISRLPYPMIIKANRSEYLMKASYERAPGIISKDDLEEGNYSGIGDPKDFENKAVSIKSIQDYSSLIENHEFRGKLEKMEPYYIKKPNIT